MKDSSFNRYERHDKCMKITDLQKLILPLFKKYKYIFILIAAGILLLLFPGGSSKTPEAVSLPDTGAISISEAERKLEGILGEAAGVGRVKVILSTKSSGQTNYAKDKRNSDSSLEENIKTVNSGGGESALIVDYSHPVYLGAIVLCDGADDPNVRLSVTQAVESFCNLTVSKITIIKMKL